jgi:hypothetical protein
MLAWFFGEGSEAAAHDSLQWLTQADQRLHLHLSFGQ